MYVYAMQKYSCLLAVADSSCMNLIERTTDVSLL